MNPATITCVSCGHRWTAAAGFSVYQQQAVEACPCPDCGAYTLCCGDALRAAAAEQATAASAVRRVAA